MNNLITASCDWVQGYLRFGHFELTLSDEQLEEFVKLPEDEQVEWITSDGNLIVDSYSINDYEKPSNIEIHKL